MKLKCKNSVVQQIGFHLPKHPALGSNSLALCVCKVCIILPKAKSKHNAKISPAASTISQKVCHYWFLQMTAILIKPSFVSLPHCWSCDDTNKQDSTPTKRMACRKNENMLEEECVQLC